MHNACQMPVRGIARQPAFADHFAGNRRPFVHDSRLGPWLGSVFAPPIRSGHDTATGPMLRFRAPLSDPLGDIRSAERWVASLPANDPLAAQHNITTEVLKVAARNARRTPAVLEAVFVADNHASGLVRNLTAQYVEHAERSPRIEEQLWQALNGFALAFESCYAAFAREIADPVPRSKWLAVLPTLLARQILHLGRNAKLRLYRCERWSAAKWTELFAPFSRACSLRFEREPVRLDTMGAPTSIERQFLMILVLKLVDPGNLAPRQLEWIAAQLDQWCQPLRLTLKPTLATVFYVDLAGSTGFRRRTLAPLEGRVLFCDLRPLHALLQQNRVVLEEAVRMEPRSSKKSQHREHLELLVKVASRIDPEYKPLARRGERSRASGAVDAVVGLSNITGLVRSDVATPSVDTSAGRNFGSTLELAVFGRTRTESEQKREIATGRVATFANTGGPWEMKDISASGFRLLAPMSIAGELTLSMLVAIRRRGEEVWAMGIIRRMRRLSTKDADIGLQIIAHTVASAELTEHKKARDGHYPINAETPVAAGRQFHGLFLSFKRQADEPPVQSLIVPTVEYHPSRRYTLRTGLSARTIRHGRLLEQHADWVWTVIDPVAPKGDAAGAGSAA